MKVILLSGGSGKRLWPLSNDSRSKQFLRILGDKEENLSSMVQRVWGQLDNVGLKDNAYIATSRSQYEILQSQLNHEVEIITEPSRRDTFPAIALATVYLYSIAGISLDEKIVVIPVDSYVEDHFFENIRRLEDVLNISNADIGLIGVVPNHPADKFGYIIPKGEIVFESSRHTYYNVDKFIEKPNVDLAEQLIDNNALWNCGVFAFRLEFIINELISRGLPIQYEELLKQYEKIDKISFDYAVVEKAKNIVAIPYEGKWKDLGTWSSLTEEITNPIIGNGLITEDTINTHIINELDIPITVINASNLVIAASPDGILISDKGSSARIKDIMKHDKRPMYEERRWGRYRVLDYIKYPESNEVLTKRICIYQGKNLSYQYHLKRSEVWTVTQGEGLLILNGELRGISTGDVVIIPVESRHSLKAITDIEIIEVQTGFELIEEDIVRLALDWNEIINDFVNVENNRGELV